MSRDETHGTDRGAGLEDWFSGPLGETLLRKEAAVLCQGVRRFHGDALLWLGPVAAPPVEIERCMVRHRVHGGVTGGAVRALRHNGVTNVFRCDVDNLPFAPASLDAVVVHHAFECSRDPRTAIREVAKALRPGGRVLVCAFNPWSFWGVRRVVEGVLEPALRNVHFVGPARLLDWLAVLGFELDDEVRYLMYRPPLTSIDFDHHVWTRPRALLESSHAPVGGVYFVLARKAAASVLPRTIAREQRAAKLIGAPLPGSTARTRR